MQSAPHNKRLRMVAEQVAGRGVSDARVLEAMRRVPREAFTPATLFDHAYDDTALPLGPQQSLSQPYIVGLMAQLLELRGTERVLDVGTGSGYGAAVLAELAREVYTIERCPELVQRARAALTATGYHRVVTLEGDGSLGYPPAAPYDRILVAAAASEIPPALIEQLAPNGRLVLPLGDDQLQTMTCLTKDRLGNIATTQHGSCGFVPLITP